MQRVPHASSSLRVAISLALVIVLVTIANFVQAVIASLVFTAFGGASTAPSDGLLAFDLGTRLVLFAVASLVGTAIARDRSLWVGTLAATVLGAVAVALMAASKEPSTWYNYASLAILVVGTLVGAAFWRVLAVTRPVSNEAA